MGLTLPISSDLHTFQNLVLDDMHIWVKLWIQKKSKEYHSK